MKILLFGEFSGLFTNLKEGLISEGHEVFLASSGDGYKNYPADFRWDVKLKKAPLLLRFILGVLNIFKHKKLLVGYDAVLLVSPMLFHQYVFLNKIVYSFLIRNNKKVFLSGTGLTPISLTFWYNSHEKYHNYADGLMKNKSYKNYYNNLKLIKWENSLHEKVNGYIPIWYEYAEPFRNYNNTLPNNISKAIFKPNRVERTNVIVDDANSYSIAMNGLFSLAKGKIVMGGAEEKGNKELCLSYNPVINIGPEVSQICDEIERLIANKNLIEDLGLKGRNFVEENHDYRKIARLYVETFEKY